MGCSLLLSPRCLARERKSKGSNPSLKSPHQSICGLGIRKGLAPQTTRLGGAEQKGSAPRCHHEVRSCCDNSAERALSRGKAEQVAGS